MKSSYLLPISCMLSFALIHCKSTESSKPKTWGDAIETIKIDSDLFEVRCPDNSVEFHSAEELEEAQGEQVCIANRRIYSYQETYLKSENLNQPGNCVIPAQTWLKLATPMSFPKSYTDSECNTFFYQDNSQQLLQRCRNFSITLLKSEVGKLKRIGSGAPCTLESGKIEGPMATVEDDEAFKKILRSSVTKDPVARGEAIREIPAKFLYVDQALGYPRLASYPSYPSLPLPRGR